MAKRKTLKPLASLRILSYSDKTRLQTQPQYRTRCSKVNQVWGLTIYRCDSLQMSSDEFITSYYQTDPKHPTLERIDEIYLTDFLDKYCNIYLEHIKPIPANISSSSKKKALLEEFEAKDSNWLGEYYEDVSFGSFDSLPTKLTNCVLIVNNPILKRLVSYGDDEQVYCFELQL